MSNRYIGIDPGGSGSVCVIDEASNVLETHGFAPLTDREIATCIADVLRAPGLVVVTIEKVGAMPGQGGSSMFRFGLVTGLAQGVCYALGAPLELVIPSKWQGDLGIRSAPNSL